MKLEDIDILLLPETEQPPKDGSLVHKIDAINLTTMKECPKCESKLKKKSSSKRTFYDYRKSPVTDYTHVYHINLLSRRYVCTNPTCRCSYTAGKMPRKKRTYAFDQYVVTRAMIGKKKEDNRLVDITYSDIAKELQISHTLVSKIIRDFVKDLNFKFLPGSSVHYLYLKEFVYQKKNRYCLMGVSTFGDSFTIGIFGNKDHKKELHEYFHRIFEDKNRKFTIVVDDIENFKKDYGKYLEQLDVAMSRQAHDKVLADCFEGKDPYNDSTLKKAVEELLLALNAYDKNPEKLTIWENNLLTKYAGEKTNSYFNDVLTLLQNDNREFCRTYSKYRIKFKSYRDRITVCDKKNMSFEKLCLCLMHYDHGDFILFDFDSYEDIEYYSDQLIYLPELEPSKPPFHGQKKKSKLRQFILNDDMKSETDSLSFDYESYEPLPYNPDDPYFFGDQEAPEEYIPTDEEIEKIINDPIHKAGEEYVRFMQELIDTGEYNW